jgi:elongator complex protein 1
VNGIWLTYSAVGDEDAVEQAVEHICFLADVNRLYHDSLGIYNLDLALLIAQKSQKDPREYLPYLQILQGLPVLQRQFQIDKYLHRYDQALRHLYDMDDFEEFLVFTEQHELYREAVGLYKYNKDRLRILMSMHADYLIRGNNFKEAGISKLKSRND